MKNSMMLGSLRVGCLVALAAVSTVPAWCGSTVVATSGQVQLVGMPSNITVGATESDSTAIAFIEQHDAALSAAVNVDATIAGLYDSLMKLTPGTVGAGTTVTDTYIHVDPVATTGTEFKGSITFSTNILGVIAQTANLNASDSVLGVSSIAYDSPTDSFRGLELGSDSFSISSDLRTLTFDVKTWGYLDDFRVLTASGVSTTNASSTPEPGTIVLLFSGIGAIAVWRKRTANVSE